MNLGGIERRGSGSVAQPDHQTSRDAGPAPPALLGETIRSDIDRMVERAEILGGRLLHITNRLVGTQPRPTEAGAVNKIAAVTPLIIGVVDGLQSLSHKLDLINELIIDLERV